MDTLLRQWLMLRMILFWFSVNWRISSFELVYANGGIHHAKKAA